MLTKSLPIIFEVYKRDNMKGVFFFLFPSSSVSSIKERYPKWTAEDIVKSQYKKCCKNIVGRVKAWLKTENLPRTTESYFQLFVKKNKGIGALIGAHGKIVTDVTGNRATQQRMIFRLERVEGTDEREAQGPRWVQTHCGCHLAALEEPDKLSVQLIREPPKKWNQKNPHATTEILTTILTQLWLSIK